MWIVECTQRSLPVGRGLGRGLHSADLASGGTLEKLEWCSSVSYLAHTLDTGMDGMAVICVGNLMSSQGMLYLCIATAVEVPLVVRLGSMTSSIVPVKLSSSLFLAGLAYPQS